MHPILQGRLRLVLYLAAWIPVLALIAYVARDAGDTSWPRAVALLSPACLLFAFACLSPWYVARVQPLQLSRWTALAVTWTSAALAGGLLLAGGAWLTWWTIAGRPWTRAGTLAAFGTVLYLLSAGLHYAVIGAENSRAADQRAAEARSLARDAQLSALRMQINPHFLFNSLHSIAALATSDGARARDMCIRLSDFLRSSLGLHDRESIPMREELVLARNYLEVERIRFGERLKVHDRIESGCEDCAIPALLLQPLVENAVKHGIAGRIQGGTIGLTVSRAGPDVVVEIENEFDLDRDPPARLGLGLSHVRRRLDVRYGEKARFTAAAREGIYRVELRFPCEPA